MVRLWFIFDNGQMTNVLEGLIFPTLVKIRKIYKKHNTFNLEVAIVKCF